MNTTIVLLILFSYLVGSIPTGYLIAKHVMHIDIREHGSGNPGAANVYRIVGKWAGISTFLIDAIKGFIPVCLARVFCPEIYAIAVVCGVVAIAPGTAIWHSSASMKIPCAPIRIMT